MTDTMTDERALSILRVSKYSIGPDTRDKYQSALDHIAARLAQPAEAVAWQARHQWNDCEWSPWANKRDEEHARLNAGMHRSHGVKAEMRALYTAPQPPAIPEPSKQECRTALDAYYDSISTSDELQHIHTDRLALLMEGMRAALTTDRARIRAKLSQGERNG